MIIFDEQGAELLTLPTSPITLDGYATHGGTVGFELDGHDVKVAHCEGFDEARQVLNDISTAYLGGASCYTVKGAQT